MSKEKEQIIMWICSNCLEPNSISGSNCPYCSNKGEFKQEVFIIKSNWIKNRVKLIDRSFKTFKENKWIDRIPEKVWNSLSPIEKEFLFNIQKGLK